ncbi:MAG TPA: hypothetical protein VF589_05195 [Allosphingosinicella sp.]|jgi:hypothetical protein
MTRVLDRAEADTAEHKELGPDLAVTAIAIVSALLNAAIFRLIRIRRAAGRRSIRASAAQAAVTVCSMVPKMAWP